MKLTIENLEKALSLGYSVADVKKDLIDAGADIGSVNNLIINYDKIQTRKALNAGISPDEIKSRLDELGRWGTHISDTIDEMQGASGSWVTSPTTGKAIALAEDIVGAPMRGFYGAGRTLAKLLPGEVVGPTPDEISQMVTSSVPEEAHSPVARSAAEFASDAATFGGVGKAVGALPSMARLGAALRKGGKLGRATAAIGKGLATTTPEDILVAAPVAGAVYGGMTPEQQQSLAGALVSGAVGGVAGRGVVRGAMGVPGVGRIAQDTLVSTGVLGPEKHSRLIKALGGIGEDIRGVKSKYTKQADELISKMDKDMAAEALKSRKEGGNILGIIQSDAGIRNKTSGEIKKLIGDAYANKYSNTRQWITDVDELGKALQSISYSPNERIKTEFLRIKDPLKQSINDGLESIDEIFAQVKNGSMKKEYAIKKIKQKIAQIDNETAQLTELTRKLSKAAPEDTKKLAEENARIEWLSNIAKRKDTGSIPLSPPSLSEHLPFGVGPFIREINKYGDKAAAEGLVKKLTPNQFDGVLNAVKREEERSGRSLGSNTLKQALIAAKKRQEKM